MDIETLDTSNNDGSEYGTTVLHAKLHKIYEEIRKECKGRIEIFGTVKFKIVDKIDGKEYRVAKIKGNTITVKQNVMLLPDSALKYIIAHELAHIIIKNHNERFWEIIRIIYPEYNLGKDLLERYKEVI